MNLLQVVLGAGMIDFLGGRIDPEKFEAYSDIAKELLEAIERPEDEREGILEQIIEDHPDQREVVDNYRILLFNRELEPEEFISVTENEG